jgi:hypothetical protein
MSAAFKTVRLSRKFVETAALEGDQLNRSAGSQIEHWAQLGRRFENLSSTTIARVKEVLAGSLSIGDLTPAEQGVALEIAAKRYTEANEAIEGAYAALPSTAGATARRRAREAAAAAE